MGYSYVAPRVADDFWAFFLRASFTIFVFIAPWDRKGFGANVDLSKKARIFWAQEPHCQTSDSANS